MKKAIWTTGRGDELVLGFSPTGEYKQILSGHEEWDRKTIDEFEQMAEIPRWEDFSIKWSEPDLQKHEFKITGCENIERTVKSGSNTSARINVPLSWQGKKVMVIRLE